MSSAPSPEWPTLNPLHLEGQRIGRDELEQITQEPASAETVQQLQVAIDQANQKIGAAKERKHLAEESGDTETARFFDARELSAGPTIVLAQQLHDKHKVGAKQRQNAKLPRKREPRARAAAIEEILRSEPHLSEKQVARRLRERKLPDQPGLKDAVSRVRRRLK